MLLLLVYPHMLVYIKFERIFWGIALQVLFALLILRWSFGKQLFQCLGSKVSNFLSFTDAGTIFAIGDFLNDTNSYAFKILPVILYFGLFVSILYHFGIIQWVIIKLGWVLQIIVGTTPCESMATVANIFLGMSEAPLVIKPYISLLTKSEIHTIMTGGFATVAGGVLAAYISFGIEPAHLLSASIMSAPAALTMSKLFYPEVEKSQTKHENIKIIRDKDKNIIHVIMTDLKDNIQLIAIITSCLVVFIGAAAFLNAFSDWGCQTLGYEEGVCEIQKFLGYLLYPVAWLMGVPSEDCHFVGYLLGMKIFVTEFLAYKELANKFKQGLVSNEYFEYEIWCRISKNSIEYRMLIYRKCARSVVIATYALCGFSSVPSMTCAVGALSCLAPSKIKDVSQVVLRAFVAGNFACILTACVAGLYHNDDECEEMIMMIQHSLSKY
ncbi:Solute carrier family 28 member 3 [Armadillidium nasatum]|uniref:Solute carrier family 28 member 3 n=1 Tax=Armadillidium nasatum TaxID=96803 RepID=A0A5N5SY09_9CRUS|nr:Solute carrier family 28 member 3 [Armadillidium nasatum]